MRRISLEYPNGRTHELDYDGHLRLEAGDEFELYGRRWRVVGRQRPARSARRDAVAVIACTSLTASS